MLNPIMDLKLWKKVASPALQRRRRVMMDSIYRFYAVKGALMDAS